MAVGDSSARTISVAAGGDLQAALDAAKPGDTILLERGAIYLGNFVLPAGAEPDRDAASSDGRVITLRTAGDTGLPLAGERITPSAAPLLAKLRSPNNGPVLQTAAAARGWRIQLLEFGANRGGAGDIITLGDGSAAQSSLAQVPGGFQLDRLYIHGDADEGQKRGIALNSAQTTIVGCHIADIKARGQDSQAIAGWNGPGDYVIENNYLEASGENVIFGGSDPAIAGLTPTHIVIRGNTLSKPLAWREPGPRQWQVKNLLELKNARQVVIEGNLLERNWRHAQSGYAVLFTVRNQDGGCDWCQVEDVRFEGNVVRDVAAGVQILGIDPGHPSRQTNHIVVRDNVFDGIDGAEWGGDGVFLQLTDTPRDITIDHNTIVQRRSASLVKMDGGAIEGFTLTNNIASHGEFGIIGNDHGVGLDSIRTFLPGAVIARNVLAGGRAALYPPDNLFPSLEELRRQFADAGGHDYRLAPGSAWRRAATDGRDLGAAAPALAATIPSAPPSP